MNIDIQHYRDNPPTISLMLFGTYCNFECEHCMYSCSPKQPKTPFSTEALNKVGWMVDTLRSLGIFPSVNLVGGEPTADLDEFERIFDHAMTFDCAIEMTTNGWWLHEVETARRFFEIVGKYIYGETADDCGEYGLVIRVSGDKFHDVFRPPHLQGKVQQYLENILCIDGYDEDGVFYKSGYWCDTCDDWVYDDPCPNSGEDHDVEWDEEEKHWYCWDCDKVVDKDKHCEGHDVYWEDEELCPRPIPPNPSYPWIYTDSRDFGGWQFVIPVGRGRVGGRNGTGCRNYSMADDLTFMPDGCLTDICCKGSLAQFGTLDDHPLMLLELGRRFAEDQRPECMYCHELATEWIKSGRLAEERRSLEPDIELITEYIDVIDDWLQENPDWSLEEYLAAEGVC